MKLFLAGIAEHHTNLTRPNWLYSSKKWKYRLGALVLILLAGLINFEARDRQWEHWKSQPELHFLDGEPLVATTDAGSFLSYAREYQQGREAGDFERSRLYPDHTEAQRAATDPEYEPTAARPAGATDIPLLSFLIAQSADLFTGGELALAGNLMIPFSVFLTVLAIGGMFWIAGYPCEGALAGVGMGMSAIFLVRTSIGRIDTDQLFFFFTAVCFSFALLAARQRTTPRMLGLVILTALSASVSHWWHPSGFFLAVVPVAMVIAIYLEHFSIKRTGVALAAFIVAANPITFLESAAIFFPRVVGLFAGVILPQESGLQAGKLTFPDTFTTITELGGSSFGGMLELLTPYPLAGVTGILGYLAWTVLCPKKGLVFLPLFILGMLSFVIGTRFALFAAPFVWFGLAWMFLCAIRWLTVITQRYSHSNSFFADGTTLAAAALGLVGIAVMSHDGYTPEPSFSVPETKVFRDLGSIAGDDGGIIVTSWDYGYHAHYHSGLATFDDPGAQNTPRTHLFARGLTSTDQDELIQITKFVSSQGTAGIEKNSGSLEALNAAIRKATMPSKPLYLVLTQEIGFRTQSIAKLGRFDVEKGLSPDQSLIEQYNAARLKCRPIDSTRLQCERGLLNIAQGTLGGKPLFGEVVVTRDGFLVSAATKNKQSPLKLIIQQLPRESIAYLWAMHSLNWNNNYNRLFHLGNYDPNRLELVMDNYPIARVFKVIR